MEERLPTFEIQCPAAVLTLALDDLPQLAHVQFGILRHTALAGTAGAAFAGAAGVVHTPDGTDVLEKFELPADIGFGRL